MARPPNKQATKTLELSVPAALHDYLGFLATHSALGASENAVALYLLTKVVEEMVQGGYTEQVTPRG